VRAVLIVESGDGYYGTDVRKAVYWTACTGKLTADILDSKLNQSM
jgi:hypothetical protein